MANAIIRSTPTKWDRCSEDVIGYAFKFSHFLITVSAVQRVCRSWNQVGKKIKATFVFQLREQFQLKDHFAHGIKHDLDRAIAAILQPTFIIMSRISVGEGSYDLLTYASDQPAGKVPLALIRLLIQKGAPLVKHPYCPTTALHVAKARGNQPLVQLLIRNGMDPGIVDEQGLPAIPAVAPAPASDAQSKTCTIL